jgi:hypothetical protein
MSGGSTDRYAIRRLNPFLGLIEVVRVEGARALSSDGVTWQIQVLTERPEHTWGSPNQHRSTRQYFRFGAWSRREGLMRVPVNPLLDIGAMLAATERLLPQLEAGVGALPFPLRDRFELWLLDREQRPLALLGSTVEEHLVDEVQSEYWSASPPAGRPFESRTLSAQGVPAVDSRNRRRHAEDLERRVHRGAASPAVCQWFRRSDDGVGTGLAHRVPASLADRVLPAEELPPLLVRADWPDGVTAAVVQDYFDWCAPRLLTLPTLTETERDRLEHAARRQAELVDQQHRLYPAVVNRELVDAARVEARLRQTAKTT